MATSNIKMHVKQDSVYNQKHPQTNSKQVLLNDNSTLDAYLKQGTTFRLVDGMLVFKDPSTGTDMTLSTSSLANRSIGNVSNLTLESLLNMANIKWEDPKDTTIATSGESVTITSWAGTKVVVKEGSVPRDVNDGTLVVDSKVRNQYKSTGLDISNLVLGKNYYVKLFPYTTEGVFTNDNTNSVHINTNGVPLDVITDITIESAGDTVFARFTDPENKTGVYKGQTYTTAEYAGTKVVMKKGSAPSNHMDGTVVAEYVNRNQYNTNENILKIKMSSEGTWYVTIFNHTTQGVYNQKVNTVTVTFLPLDNVTNLSVTSNELTVTVKWDDPQDKLHFLGTDHNIATWSGTKLVRKEGSEPTDVNDGVLLVDSKVHNQYHSSGYVDRGLVEGKTYFYKLFPYTDRGKITNNSANSAQVTPIIPDDIFGTPGPAKLLAGDKTEGYYGVVSPNDLISGINLASLVNLTAGTPFNNDQGWLKFNLDGKIIFIAKKSFRHSISLSQLKSAGLIYGRHITIKGHSYMIRLIKGSASDPIDTSTTYTLGSEWNRLMLPIHKEAPNSWKVQGVADNRWGGVSKDWGIDFSDTDLGVNNNNGVEHRGTYIWVQDGVQGTGSGHLRGLYGISSTGTTGNMANTEYHGWRPLLEYIGPAFEDTSGSPGASKTIVRSENEGYFGEVPATQLITGSSLATQVGLTAGTSQYDGEGWLKFISDGKILFVAKKPFRNNITWFEIEAANAITGAKTVYINGLTYKVRLFKGLLNNSSSYTNTKGSEWNRLMLPIHIHAKDKSWQYPQYVESNISDWGIEFKDTDLISHFSVGNGSCSWCQESVSESPTGRLFRSQGGISGSSWDYASARNAGHGWRPVLELVQ